MMALDVQLHGFKHRLDWDFFKKVIFAGLANGQTCDLVRSIFLVFVPVLHVRQMRQST